MYYSVYLRTDEIFRLSRSEKKISLDAFLARSRSQVYHTTAEQTVHTKLHNLPWCLGTHKRIHRNYPSLVRGNWDG